MAVSKAYFYTHHFRVQGDAGNQQGLLREITIEMQVCRSTWNTELFKAILLLVCSFNFLHGFPFSFLLLTSLVFFEFNALENEKQWKRVSSCLFSNVHQEA